MLSRSGAMPDRRRQARPLRRDPRRAVAAVLALVALTAATGCPGTRFSRFPGFGSSGTAASRPGGVLDPALLDIG